MIFHNLHMYNNIIKKRPYENVRIAVALPLLRLHFDESHPLPIPRKCEHKNLMPPPKSPFQERNCWH